MSVPVSVCADVDRTRDGYDVLQGVNGNYADLPTTEIRFRALIMPAESRAGLVSLTKGACHEQLVALDTGGASHERFNLCGPGHRH